MASTPADRMKLYRERQRAKGLKQKQIWVYDTSSPTVRAQIARDMAAIVESREEAEIYDWLDAVRDWPAEDK